MTKEAIIFVGLQASGKTTYYNLHYKQTHVHINMDTIHSRVVENRIMNNCLTSNYSFVVDNTNPTPERRKMYIDAAKSKGYKVKAIYFDVPMDECKTQNEKRKGKVPLVALYTTRKKMIIPTLQEGFDEVTTITKKNFLCEE